MINYKQMYHEHPFFWWLILILRICFVLMCVYFLIKMKKEDKEN